MIQGGDITVMMHQGTNWGVLLKCVSSSIVLLLFITKGGGELRNDFLFLSLIHTNAPTTPSPQAVFPLPCLTHFLFFCVDRRGHLAEITQVIERQWNIVLFVGVSLGQWMILNTGSFFRDWKSQYVVNPGKNTGIAVFVLSSIIYHKTESHSWVFAQESCCSRREPYVCSQEQNFSLLALFFSGVWWVASSLITVMCLYLPLFPNLCSPNDCFCFLWDFLLHTWLQCSLLKSLFGWHCPSPPLADSCRPTCSCSCPTSWHTPLLGFCLEPQIVKTMGQESIHYGKGNELGLKKAWLRQDACG